MGCDKLIYKLIYERHLVEAHNDHHGRNYCMECDKGNECLEEEYKRLRQTLQRIPTTGTASWRGR